MDSWIRCPEEDVKKGEELRAKMKAIVDSSYYLGDPIINDSDYNAIFGGHTELLEVKKDDA